MQHTLWCCMVHGHGFGNVDAGQPSRTLSPDASCDVACKNALEGKGSAATTATLVPLRRESAWVISELAMQMVQPASMSSAQHSCAVAKMRMVTVRPLALNTLPW